MSAGGPYLSGSSQNVSIRKQNRHEPLLDDDFGSHPVWRATHRNRWVPFAHVLDELGSAEIG